MNFILVLRAAAVLLTLGAALAPALADDADTCRKASGDDSIAACSRLLARNPKDADAYYSRGYAYEWRKGEHDRAIADFDQAIVLNPKYARAYADRGFSYEHKGEWDRAIADYEQAIQLDPKLVVAYTRRGSAYDHKGEYDRAIADYEQAIQLNPKLANAYSHRGFAYGMKGNFDRALTDLDKAIALNPTYARGYSYRGAIYELRGDLGRAIEDYDQALKLNPALPDVRRYRERTQAALAARPALTQRDLTKPVAVAPDRRVALVIGNSQYRSVAFLPNPRRDAAAVADALQQVGFQVELAMDLDRDGMVKALRSFRDQADQADWALIYFAGHGIEIERVNYLIPTDARLLDDRDVKAETVSYEELLSTVNGARALRLVVLDACRNNPFKDQMHRTVALRGPTDRGLVRPPETVPGTVVVYSAKEGEVAIDDAGGANSPFASALIAELKVPGVELRRVFDNVRDDVLEATDNRQQPFTYGSLPGRRDFFFVAAK
jgi:tetratricopeptide (TPR) repeat protein